MMELSSESSASAGILLAILLLFLVASLFKLIRPKFGVKVECWFCGEPTKVPYGNFNCWDCPSCEQYNGFNKDGGYNKEIPSQFSEDMNHGISCSRDEFLDSNTTLCSRCTTNQQLKIKQLSNYLPYKEDNYDKEIEAYNQHLEYDYQLCDLCIDAVKKELQRQDGILLKNMEDFDNRKYRKTADVLIAKGLNKRENMLAAFVSSRPILLLMKMLSIMFSSLLLMNYTWHLLNDGFLKLSALDIFLWPFRTLLPLRSDCCFWVIAFGLVLNVGLTVKLSGSKRRTSTDILCSSLWCLQLVCHLLPGFGPTSQRIMGALISWTALLLSCLSVGCKSNLPKVTLRRLSLINNKNDSKSSDELDRSYENKCCSEPAKDFIDLPSVALTERKHSCRENAVGLINTNLNSISLGPITPRTHSPAPCFSPLYTQLPSPSHDRTSPSSKSRHSLIHPARFTVVRPKSEKHGLSLRKRLFSDWENESNITTSTQSSVCLVGSTTDNVNVNVKPLHSNGQRSSFTDDETCSSRSGMLPAISPTANDAGLQLLWKPVFIFGAILAASIFLNTILVTYIMTKMYG